MTPTSTEPTYSQGYLVGAAFALLITIALALPSDPGARRFVIGVLVAFLPAALVGYLARDFIKNVLFETPVLICAMLILGGFVLLAVDRMKRPVLFEDVQDIPLKKALGIGLELIGIGIERQRDR